MELRVPPDLTGSHGPGTICPDRPDSYRGVDDKSPRASGKEWTPVSEDENLSKKQKPAFAGSCSKNGILMIYKTTTLRHHYLPRVHAAGYLPAVGRDEADSGFYGFAELLNVQLPDTISAEKLTQTIHLGYCFFGFSSFRLQRFYTQL